MRVVRTSRGQTTGHGAARERLVQREWSVFTGERDSGADGSLDASWCRNALIELMAREYVGAMALGPVVVGDATVVALVVIDDDRVEARARAGVAPALDRITLRERLEQGGRMAVSPVREVAFVGVWGRTDLTGLTRLGGYGETMLIAPPATVLDPVELAECDWRGVGVLQAAVPADIGGTHWHVMPGVRPRPWATNMRYEQLLELAMRTPTSLRPDVPSSVQSESTTEDASGIRLVGSSGAVVGAGGPGARGGVESPCDQSVG